MSAPQQRFICVCGGSYTSSSGLKQHQRRYCRGRPNEDQNKCPVCNTRYETYPGMRQHMKQAHPVEYNNDLKTESANARGLWTEEEVRELAGKEAECDPGLPTGAILDHLAQHSKRSRDALKSRRRNPQYIEMVRNIRERRTNEEAAIDDRNDGDAEGDRTILNNEIKLVLSELRQKLNIAEDIQLLDGLLHLPQDDAVRMLNNWCEALVGQYTRPSVQRGTNRASARAQLLESINRPGLSNRRRRALEFRLAQTEYKRDLKSFADGLLDGTACMGNNTIPSIEDIRNHYNEVFNTPSTQDMEPIANQAVDATRISTPILEEDIAAAITSSKSNSPGPDGATIKDIARIPRPRLMLLYNAMLLLESIPAVFTVSRTILIPKNDENLQLVGNWRPLTISSTFMRIMNKILSQRMTSLVDLHEHQRGFSKIDGCFANCITLECLLKTRRKTGQPLTLISLDLSKAFDRVSHYSLLRALKNKNIDIKTIQLIMANYENASTNLTCNGINVDNYNIKRGVKQGDPLSPILFNMILDELITELAKRKGVTINNSTLSALAYADDIVLCAEDRDDARRLLDATVEFLKKRGLELNVRKCHSLVLRRVPSKKKIYVDDEPYFKIGNEFINPITIRDELSYLGQKFSTMGLKKCNKATLYQQLTAIRRSPLKPQQKMVILRTYLIPRYIASLQKPNASQKLLKDVDKKIRAFTRVTLHLNAHCSNGVFYAPLKSGGLGLFCFAKMIPAITRNRLQKLRDASTLLSDTISAMQPALDRINRQIDPNHNNTADIRISMGEQLNSSYNGKGLEEAQHHEACRRFITRPPVYWNGEQYIKAIQLRYNLLPTVGIPSNPPEARRCRAGCSKVESLSHLLQRCPLTHWKRVARHDFVLKRLAKFARKHQWTTQIEPHIRASSGRLYKPDAIFIKADTVIVIEVGINWEGEITLEMQYDNKKAIYSSPEVLEKLGEMYPRKEICIMPLIMGARGTWCRKNQALANQLQLSKGDVCELINTVLRGGWMIHSDFMRTVWRSRRTGRRIRRN